MKKVISLFLVLLMFIVMVAACGYSGNNDTSDETSAADTTVDISSPEGTTRQPLTVPGKDYGGYQFKILSINTTVTGNGTSVNGYYYSDFVDVPDRSGEPINDAVYARNLKILEDYNVEVVTSEVADVYTESRKIIQSGENIYDIITPHIDSSFKLAQEKFIYNLYNIPYLDLNNPWWDEVLVEKLSLNNKIYIITGDISMHDEEYNWGLIANKVLLEQNGFTDIYTVIKDGKLTFDYVHKIGSSVTRDLNGDGIIDWNDQYAFGNSYSGCQFFYFAAGENIAALDKDGYPRLTLGGEGALAVMDKVREIFNDTNFMLWTENMKGVTNPWGYFRTMFKENRLMILMTNIFAIKELRDMFDDFAIFPPPKYEEKQENYYTIVETQFLYGICVPVTVPAAELERTGIILEAMAYYSKPIQEAHMDVTITGKFLRDEDSREMLEIIFKNRTYDIGKAFGWGDYIGQMYAAVRDNKAFVSLYEANRERAETAIAKSYALFSELD